MLEDISALMGRVAELIEKVEAEKFEVEHDTGLFKVDPALVTTVSGILDETSAFLSAVQEYYDGDDEDATPTPGRRIGAQEIADVAYMSRGEMRSVAESLQTAHRDKQVWQVLSHADAGLGRSERALIAVESLICEHEGIESPPRTFFNLEDSLAIRRQYALLRSSLSRAGTPEGEALVQALSDAVEHITALRSLKVYILMRIADRLLIRSLQKRIQAGLEMVGSENEHDRQVLWQDLVSAVRLLMEVSQRQELREHDRRLALEAWSELERSDVGDGQLQPRTVERLGPLLGRSPELDLLLLAVDGRSVTEARDILCQLKDELKGLRVEG